MLIARYKQQSGERRKRTLDYSNVLPTGVTISAVTSTLAPTTSPALAVSSITVATNGKSFSYFVSGGLTDNDYLIEFFVTLSDTQIREDEVEITIEDLEA
mgnify:CR=1 FL=1